MKQIEKPSDTFRADEPGKTRLSTVRTAEQQHRTGSLVLKRLEPQIGLELIARLYLAFRNERLNNRVLALQYQVSRFDVVVLRSYPWRVLSYLVASMKERHCAVILPLQKRA